MVFAQNRHEGRHQQRADDEGVEEDGGDEHEAQLVDEAHLRQDEPEEGDGHGEARGGDDAAGRAEAEQRALRRRDALLGDELRDACQQEEIVVERDADDDAEGNDRGQPRDGADAGDRGRVQPVEDALLVDEHRHAEDEGLGEGDGDDAAQRDDDGAEGKADHDGDGDAAEDANEGKVVVRDLDGVDGHGANAADIDGDVIVHQDRAIVAVAAVVDVKGNLDGVEQEFVEFFALVSGGVDVGRDEVDDGGLSIGRDRHVADHGEDVGIASASESGTVAAVGLRCGWNRRKRKCSSSCSCSVC